MSVALQWSPTPVGLSSLPNAEGSVRLPNVGGIVNCDVVDI